MGLDPGGPHTAASLLDGPSVLFNGIPTATNPQQVRQCSSSDCLVPKTELRPGGGVGACSDGPGGLGCLTSWIPPLPAPPRGPERPEGGAALEPRSQSGETNKQPSVHPSFRGGAGDGLRGDRDGDKDGQRAHRSPPPSPFTRPSPGRAFFGAKERRAGIRERTSGGERGGPGIGRKRPSKGLPALPPPLPLTASPPTLSPLRRRR